MDGFPRLPMLLLALLLAPTGAGAVIFVVDTTVDAADATLDGTCADAAGRCTLRAAVQEANATAAVPDGIQLPAGVYKLTETGALENAAASGDLDVTDPLTIEGGGAAVTIVQGKKDRVFDVLGSELYAYDLTITKGSAPKHDDDDEAAGGGIRNTGHVELARAVLSRNKAADDSGAIANSGGELVLSDVTFSGNKAKDDAGAMDNDGGSILLVNVTFSKNKAGDEAGAFESESGGTIQGSNVTISGNKAKEAGGANAEQDGIVSLVNATIIGNKSKLGGGGVQQEDDGSAAAFNLQNAILAGNKKTNCSGTITSLGGNIDSGTSCGFAPPNDLSSVADVGLDKKLASGGDTPTHSILEGSPAIDFGLDALCPLTDQRGQTRVDIPAVGADNVLCDSGAVEFIPPS